MKYILKKIITFIITLEARVVLYKYKPEIIAVTGSVGKTSAKDAIWTVLSDAGYVWRGEKSFNSEIGIPLTILGCENAWGSASGWLKIMLEGLGLIVLKNHYPRTLVIEVGTDRPGDVRKISSWLKPDIVVVTAFPIMPVHIEFFPSRDALIREKTYIVRALKSSGLLILNADDAEVLSLKQQFLHNTITFGKNETADVSVADARIEYDKQGRPIGMFGKIAYRGNKLPLHLHGVLGAHIFLSALAALAVGVGRGLNVVSALESLEHTHFPPGRMRLLGGVGGSIIIDDSYNSSPIALNAALDTVHEINVSARAANSEGGRKIAALGDMLELGAHSAQEHKKIGARIPEIFDVLVTVGIRARGIAEAALEKKMERSAVRHFENSILAGEFLKGFLRQGDVVLVKGSQTSIRMERAVERILQNPEDKKLLVRQEKEWALR